MDSPAFVVRIAVGADLAALPEVECQSDSKFAELPSLLPTDAPLTNSAELVRACDEGRLWVVDVGTEIVGFALALNLETSAHLEQLSVVPSAQGKGIGSALIEQATLWAGQSGHTMMTLSTFRFVAWNAPFYERRGFTVVPEHLWTPELREIRKHEAAIGLDVTQRVLMSRSTSGPVAGSVPPPSMDN